MNNSELFIEVWEVDRARMARARRATQCVKKVSVQRVVDRRCTTAQFVTSRDLVCGTVEESASRPMERPFRQVGDGGISVTHELLSS